MTETTTSSLENGIEKRSFKPKNLKSPHFRLFILFFYEILYRSYLIAYINRDLWGLL